MAQCPYPETEAEYAQSSDRNKGTHCPSCGAVDVEYGGMDFEVASIFQNAYCRCGFVFYDKYHLAGFVEVVQPDFEALKQAAMDAEEIFTLDELEEHAKEIRDANLQAG